MVYTAMFAVLLAICSWISIPTAVPFTLQTFGIFITISLLGGKRGTAAMLVWMLLGAVGIPVFSGFKGGLGVLLGTTGGYIIGFLFMGLLYWAMIKFLGNTNLVRITSMVLGLAVCYTFGTIWFILIYAHTTGPISLMTALSWCVIPFIIPDLIKLFLAFMLVKRLEPHIDL